MGNNDNKNRDRDYENLLKEERKLAAIRSRYIVEVTKQMRTPLNVISGMVGISRSNVTDSHKVSDCLEKMSDANRTIESLVEKLQDLAYIGEEIILGKPSTVVLESIAMEALKKAVEMLPNMAECVTIEARVVHPIVEVDERHLFMALCFVISEALRGATPADRMTLIISEKLTTGDGKGIYEITIDKRSIERTVNPADVTGYEREISMAKARAILGAMGGSIDISAIGGKDRLRITMALPIGDEVEMEFGEVEIDNIDFWGMKVLVAEDNVLNMQVMEDPLKSRGIIVTKTWDGREAFDTFMASEDGAFDLVILDAKMQQMDGYKTARAIRESGRGDAAEVIIFMVTAEDDEKAVRKVYDSGVDRYFLKPINVNEILREYIRMTE